MSLIVQSSTLWPFFFFSLLLAFLCDNESEYTYGDYGERIYVYKNRTFYTVLVISIVFFVGLRRWCNDTGEYREIYEYITPATGSIFRGIRLWKLGESPGFELVNRILKHLGCSSQTYLLAYSVATNGLYSWFLRKHSTHFWLSFFLFWTMGCYIFTAAAIRQCAAMAIGLIGVDYALEEKWRPFVIWILISALFHPYTILYLILPWLRFSPWTKPTWYLLFGSVAAGFGLQLIVGVLLSVASLMGREYSEGSFSGEGVSLFRLLVIWAPIILSFLLREQTMRSEDVKNNIFLNLSFINAGLMFVALFGTANYFARLANYFLFFQTLALPWMLRFIKVDNRRTVRYFIIVCYFLYFFYTNTIYIPFNRYFAKMSLWEYLTQAI